MCDRVRPLLKALLVFDGMGNSTLFYSGYLSSTFYTGGDQKCPPYLTPKPKSWETKFGMQVGVHQNLGNLVFN